MEIVTQEGDIAAVKVDAIVKSDPYASVPIGEAVYIEAGALPYKGIVYAPVTENAASRVTVENVRKATQAALICADSYGVKVLALPALGTGPGGLSLSSSADAIIETLRHYESNTVRKVILISKDPAMVDTFRSAIFAERS